MDIDERLRVINDCIELVNESENVKTRLSSYDLLIEHARALLEYEVRGIPTIKPHPSHFVMEHNARRDQIVLEGVTQEVEKMLAEAKAATTFRKSITEANKALAKIKEGRQEIRVRAKLDQLEAQVRVFLDQKERLRRGMKEKREK